nr:M48 family metallopeptidase [Canibacter zhuwentaonis]
MTFFVLIIGGLGYLAGVIYNSYTVTVFIVLGAVGYTLVQYFMASRQALSMAGAVQITERDNPRLYRTVENLVITTGMPMPKVYIVNDPAPNAFATGRNPENAVVAATTGLLEIMTDAELEGVMAHELGHVRNYDIRVNMIVYGLVVAVGMIGDMLMHITVFGRGRNSNNPVAMIFGIVAMLIAPLVATVVQLAVSRQREYLADATGALTTRHPVALASALHKLQEHAQPLKRQQTSMAHMWISDPNKAGFVQQLFATHPPIESRIKRLLENQAKF